MQLSAVYMIATDNSLTSAYVSANQQPSAIYRPSSDVRKGIRGKCVKIKLPIWKCRAIAKRNYSNEHALPKLASERYPTQPYTVIQPEKIADSRFWTA